MRNLDPARAKRERDIDHLADPVDVGAMHYGVHGEQQLAPSDFGRKRPLAGKRTVIPGDVIGGWILAVLYRDLHMVEPGLRQRA